ncbi:membrane protein insertion efficiency factor YidD [Betaproteobacteria bacterium]|nr:membrane protein insertion efficiency factor YidD [Betaproteobacteria bacterium]
MFVILKNFLINLFRITIKCYKLSISSLYGPRCRFLPTCSDYAEEAVKVHGPIRGLALIISRLIRCNVLAKQRVDPVPRKRNREV